MRNVVKIASKQENLREIEKLVDEFNEIEELDESLYGKVMLATIEAANNAIVHGNKLDPEKKVKVEIIKRKERIEIYIEDQGSGFDYMRIPDPTAPENIENIHGRGVFLMKQLSDEVNFYKNGTKVQILFKI
ncbi:MAG: ATP-binding protein [Bacteroidales bacterium]|jgi:serine/threonine-protein kinase RsbW|nr:ATP-binding protein [Bacteroidales bacterium]